MKNKTRYIWYFSTNYLPVTAKANSLCLKAGSKKQLALEKLEVYLGNSLQDQNSKQ